MANRLARESSPYLLQHRDNPVDWYPWGAEAFEKARAEDKPMFISIGYAACHWCHVMERECFEDPEIAARMNELFVNVKVDREERPDVDAIYISAIHVMGERGGWPLSAFCDADGRPFYVGTYFPPGDRYGRPGFPRVLEALARAYGEERDKVDQNARAVIEGLQKIDEIGRRGAAEAGGPGDLAWSLIADAGRALAERADPDNGGIGGAPKFPSPSAHDLLARASRGEGGELCRQAFLRQARAMARGGVYDHLGGGFARYSVDDRWLVPHFEKMLYDNGQLLSIYGDAYAMTGEARFAEVIRETAGWLEREMSDPGSGGLYASLDADSEGEEGRYYVWTPEEVEEALGPADAIRFSSAYGVTRTGNFEGGKSVLSRVREPESAEEEAALTEMRARLFRARQARPRPATDDKILAGWNGLALSGLVRAWEATGHEPAGQLAGRVAEFLAREMVAEGGGLWRVYKEGERKLDGTVEDYAYAARGLLAYAAAAQSARHFELARALASQILERFYAEEGGVPVFYMSSGEDARGLVHRPESYGDGALPAGASVAVECLLAFGRLGADERAFAVAERYLAARAPGAAENPFMASRLLAALDLYLSGIEIAVAEGAGADELRAAARAAYAPTALMAGPYAAPTIWEGKAAAADGRALAYICRGPTCSAPTSDPTEVARLVAGA